jgi:hypothetical protein
MRDWRGIAQAAEIAASPEALERIAASLESLEQVTAPLYRDLGPEMEPATVFRPDGARDR